MKPPTSSSTAGLTTPTLALIICGAAFAWPTDGRAEVALAENGRSDYRIVIAAEASPSTRYAAEELQHFLERMTGARLPLAVDTGPTHDHEILVGMSRRLDESGIEIDLRRLGKEGYMLRTAGRRLVIAGGDPRGTLYGVYGLLEDHLGCRWFTPDIDRVPRARRLSLPQLDELRLPAFEYRETYTWESYDGNWMARNRLNGAGGRGRLLERQGIRPPMPELDARHGGDIRFGFGFFVHTIEKLVPAERYFSAHPEYFALWEGKRDPDQVCCTNEDVIRLCTEAILRGMREQPKATVFSLSQNDNKKYCRCDRCAALAKAEGTQMAQILHLVNRAAEAAEREFPDKIVETLAYQWTRKAPASMRPRRNVVIRLCDIECCFAHPLASGCNDRNTAFVDDLRAWAKVCDRLWIWDYTTNYSHYLLPMPNKRLLDDNIRLFAANHVTGVFEQGTYDTPDSEMVALKAYLIAKFLWDTRYDEARATGEFLDAYYGAAADPIHRYLDLIHDYAQRHSVHVGIFVPPTHPHLTPHLLAQANALWDEAEACAQGTPDALDRVRRSRMSADYAIAEQARAASRIPAQDRTEGQRAVIALALERFSAFTGTMADSPLTRIREWKDCDKAEYRAKLAADLGIETRVTTGSRPLPGAHAIPKKGARPNIVFILADDLGYGDVGCFNEAAKIATPHLDRLASEGMRFTDAHAPASVCVPSRYGLLTGRYPWRTWSIAGKDTRDRKDKAVPHYQAPMLMHEPARLNLATLLRRNGYATAAFGKWHQGMSLKAAADGTLSTTPVDLGFDYYFGIDAPEQGPYAFIENKRFCAAPTEKIPEQLGTDVTNPKTQGQHWHSGDAAPGWDFGKCLPTIADKADAWIQQHTVTENHRPFFIYHALPAPHAPWMPLDRFKGKSRAGPYGDYVMTVDAIVGQFLDAIDRAGLRENTVVFFSSDNGPVWYEQDIARHAHRGTAGLRGMKGALHEGGHRVPFIARWPGKIPGGSVCHQLVCFTDMMATFASLIDVALPEDAGADSHDISPLLQPDAPTSAIRTTIVLPNWSSHTLAIRAGDWKLILPQHGYVVEDQTITPGHVITTQGKRPPEIFELYNLRDDPAETANLCEQEPEKVQELFAALKANIERGRSAPGTSEP